MTRFVKHTEETKLGVLLGRYQTKMFLFCRNGNNKGKVFTPMTQNFNNTLHWDQCLDRYGLMCELKFKPTGV